MGAAGLTFSRSEGYDLSRTGTGLLREEDSRPIGRALPAAGEEKDNGRNRRQEYYPTHRPSHFHLAGRKSRRPEKC